MAPLQILKVEMAVTINVVVRPFTTERRKVGEIEVAWGKVEIGGQDRLVVASQQEGGETTFSVVDLPG